MTSLIVVGLKEVVNAFSCRLRVAAALLVLSFFFRLSLLCVFLVFCVCVGGPLQAYS